MLDMNHQINLLLNKNTLLDFVINELRFFFKVNDQSADCLPIYLILIFADFQYIEDVKGYVSSNRGKSYLVDQQGFVYAQNRFDVKTGKVFWRCSLRIKNKCMVNAVTLENKITNRSREHNHLPQNPQI